MTYNTLNEAVKSRKHSALVDFMLRLVKEKPLGTMGLIITIIVLFFGIFADFLAPFGMNEINPADALTAPSTLYRLGTDNLGRDVLSRIIFGARTSVIVGLAGAGLATIISVLLGTLTGYLGGKFDMVAQRLVDAVMCIPGLILVMVVISMMTPGIWTVIITLGTLTGITGSRVVRGVVMSTKEKAYIDAARAIGGSTPKILIQHILPNIMAPIIILFTTRVPAMIMVEASLSFLGFGVPPPDPTWGGMLSGSGRRYMFLAPWMAIWPGVALATVIYGVNMFGDAVRDLLDPRLKGGAGRYGKGMPGSKKKIGSTVKGNSSRL